MEIRTKLIKLVESASPEDLVFINRQIIRIVNNGLTMEQALKVEMFQVGDPVKYSDNKGQEHFATVSKINRRFVKLSEQGHIISRLPSDLIKVDKVPVVSKKAELKKVKAPKQQSARV